MGEDYGEDSRAAMAQQRPPAETWRIQIKMASSAYP
jgi:hypothetical protein